MPMPPPWERSRRSVRVRSWTSFGGSSMRSRRASSDQGARKQPRAVTSPAVTLDRAAGLRRAGAEGADHPERDLVPVGGLGTRGDHGLDRPHLSGPAGGLGPGDAVALDGVGTGEPAGGAGHRILPGGFQLSETLVGPGGAGASAVPQGLGADFDDPACVVESGPVRRPRDPEQQRVARAHAARVPRERHRRVVHRAAARQAMWSPATNGSSPVHAIQRSGAGDRASRAVSCPMAALTAGRQAASRKASGRASERASGRPALSTSRSCASVSFSAEASSSFQFRSRSSHAAASWRGASGKAARLVRVCAIAVAWL